VLVLLILGFLGPGISRSGPARSLVPEPYDEAAVIRFANGASIDTRSAPPPADSARLSAGSYWLVHLAGPVQEEWLRALAQTGARPVCYLAYQNLVCRITREIPAASLKQLDFTGWLGPLPPSAKLAPEVANRLLLPQAELGSSLFTPHASLLVLSVWPGEGPDLVAASVADAGGDVSDVTGSTVRFRIDVARLPELAALEPVAWIQEHSEAVSYNHDAQWVMQVGWQPEPPDEVTGRRVWQHGIRGQGMVVGLFDSGIATEHDMFVDPNYPITAAGLFPEHRKVVAYKLYRTAVFGDAGGVNYHGTAVAGTLCGDDSISGNLSRLDGIAPEARIYFVDNANASGNYVFDPDLTALLDSVRLSRGMDESVRQVSGSFGSGLPYSTYRLEEASLDAVSWQDKEFLVVWAAGNFGGRSYALGHPSGAKNALTVGSCGNGTASNLVSDFSSRGPCLDERIKPNLLAPGQGIATAYGREPHAYSGRNGTSLSAPATSGALMLLRQYFNEGWYPTGVPDSGHRITYLSSALMRALAIAGADTDVGTELTPNHSAGWGRLNLSNVMHFAGDSTGFTFLDESLGLATGQTQDYRFELTGREPVQVVLAWTDTAATPEAAIALVNDLNLELLSPEGIRYCGNQFYEGWSKSNPPDWDERNVEEVCKVNHASPGVWTVRVHGRNVYTRTQPYAVAVKGSVAGMVPAVSESRQSLRPRLLPLLLSGARQFRLPEGASLTLFTSDGRIVGSVTGTVLLGNDQAGRPLKRGVYFYRLESAGSLPVAGKLVLVR
jgi:hypothetical protein